MLQKLIISPFYCHYKPKINKIKYKSIIPDKFQVSFYSEIISESGKQKEIFFFSDKTA